MHRPEEFHLVADDALHRLDFIGNQCHHGGGTGRQAFLDPGFPGFVNICEDVDFADSFFDGRAEIRIGQSAATMQDKGKTVASFVYLDEALNVQLRCMNIVPMQVADSDGKGIDQMFLDLGAAAIVNGSQTMNPSTEDILAGIESVPSARVLVLANNKNIIMAAEAACGLADRTALTVSTRSVPQGLSAMLSFDPSVSLEEN